MASGYRPVNLASWLARVDRDDPALLEFAQRVDDACREAERVTGRELPARLAAVVVLRVAADGLAAEKPKTSPEPVDWQPTGARWRRKRPAPARRRGD